MNFLKKNFFLVLIAAVSLSTLFSQQIPSIGNQSVVKVTDYTQFLNCVAATDTYGLYNIKMGEDTGLGPIITRSGNPGSYTYSCDASKASFPVTYVSWLSAVRYCNWKSHHGAIGLQDSATTETGSYDLTVFDQGADIATVTLNPGANFFLPTNYLIDTTFQDSSNQSCDSDLASNRLGFAIATPPSSSSSEGTSGGNASPNSTGIGGVNGNAPSANTPGSIATAQDPTLSPSTNFLTNSLAGDISTGTFNSNQITISLVSVGLPNNIADSSSTHNATTTNNVAYGAVLRPYQIGKYDVTAEQYCAFLNAVAKSGDPHGLYNINMTSDPDVACITRSSDGTNGYTYAPINGRKDFPITYVSWFAATRFCNWLENGQPTGNQIAGITETGAFEGGIPVPGAAWSLPTEDQWYKAAYYIPSTNSTSGKYCAFGTGSMNDAPGNKWEEAVVGNRANYAPNGVFTIKTQPHLTPVGSFTASASPWGAYDMAGEVQQWTSTFDASEKNVIIRGGSWKSQTSDELQSTTRFTNSGQGSSTIGFRVVYNIPPAPVVTHLDMMKDLVPVVDPHNEPDDATVPGGVKCGSVPTVYQIGKYDVTAEQYCMFLNAVATHADPHALYNTNMASDPDVACIQRYGNPNKGYSYFTIPGREKFPITYVNWFSAIRFCNWLEHDQPIGDESPETTESGSFNSDEKRVFNLANNNPKWTLPTEDQWYKAAYYQPAKDGNPATYCSFGTGSYSVPANSLLTMSNSANYCLNGLFTTSTQPRLTPVGTFNKTMSPCGAYDMAGNVNQWTRTPLVSKPNELIVRGGSWQSTNSQELRFTEASFVNANNSSNTIGFRVVYNVPPPPPSAKNVATAVFNNVINTLLDDGKAYWNATAGTDPNVSGRLFNYVTGPFIAGGYKWLSCVATLVARNISLFFQQVLTRCLPEGVMEVLNNCFRGVYNFFFKSIGLDIADAAGFGELGLFESIGTSAGEWAMLTANPPLAAALIIIGYCSYIAYHDLQQSDVRAGITFASFDIGYIIGLGFTLVRLGL